jgi:hypothetical protein
MFKNYVETLSFDNTNQVSMKITPIALKTIMFSGPIKLHERGIHFRLQHLNQWKLESIFDIIYSFNMNKPTKKQFICSINQILQFY